MEFVRCPGLKGIYGKHKYDLFGHGGLLFWSSTSLFFAIVSLSRSTPFRLLPARKEKLSRENFHSLSRRRVKPRANGRNIVGQQIPTLLCLFARPVACCYVLLGVVAQRLKPVKRLATCKRMQQQPKLLGSFTVTEVSSMG